jgi:hypothetical protein
MPEAQRRGDEVVTEGEPAQETDVVDPLDALRASVEADLSGMTKAELYPLAQDPDVGGRSSMDRDELESAVRKGRRSGDRAAS